VWVYIEKLNQYLHAFLPGRGHGNKPATVHTIIVGMPSFLANQVDFLPLLHTTRQIFSFASSARIVGIAVAWYTVVRTRERK
jgi:hypothetical protein